jgi:hypothetical protein
MTKEKKPAIYDFSNLPPENVPVKQGRYFCSPACQHRCQWVHFERSVKAAKSLARKLGGKPWIGSVWENREWGFRADAEDVAVIGRFQLHTRKPKVYFRCEIQGFHVPTMNQQWFATPQRSMEATFRFYLQKIAVDLGRLFLAAETTGSKGEFFRILTQLKAVEFLRYPSGRPSMSPNP